MLGGDYLRFVLLVQFQESKTLLTLGTCLPPLFIRNAVCAYVCSYSCVRCVCVCEFVSVCVWVVVHVHGFRLFLETLGFLRRAFQQETELRARVYRFEPSSASSFSFFFLSLSFFVSLVLVTLRGLFAHFEAQPVLRPVIFDVLLSQFCRCSKALVRVIFCNPRVRSFIFQVLRNGGGRGVAI